jgi:hypothetical protein
MVIQAQEAFRTPNRQDQNRTSSCHILPNYSRYLLKQQKANEQNENFFNELILTYELHDGEQDELDMMETKNGMLMPEFCLISQK